MLPDPHRACSLKPKTLMQMLKSSLENELTKHALHESFLYLMLRSLFFSDFLGTSVMALLWSDGGFSQARAPALVQLDVAV